MGADGHLPALAAGDQATGPRRSLLLAGGGIRVAYQAGVLLALNEAGLKFAHGDGTSGGTMNLAMVLSGIPPAEACSRWRTLNPLAFASPPAVRWLLRGPPYPALGSSEGIRRRVYPHLGIDVERIHAVQGIVGTFNVCDVAAKANLAVAHDEVDLDVLVAGVSLPIVSPSVRWRGRVLVDSVWIKDVNVAEAMRRGAEELWLVWCIGNHGVWRDGAFQQYVHMIELSANGSLQEELAAIDRPVRLHVIKPRVPLPLDPDFFFGRIDAATLIAMGYRDACAYLAHTPAGGLPLDGRATRMADPRPGIGFRERLAGDVGAPLELRVGWEIDDLEAFLRGPRVGTLVGDATHEVLGDRWPAQDGDFALAASTMRGRLRFTHGLVEFERSLRDWGRVRVRIRDQAGEETGAGVLTAARSHAPTRVHARGVASMGEGLRTQARFWRWWLRARS